MFNGFEEKEASSTAKLIISAFSIAAASILTIVLLGFCCYHCCLIAKGKTTREHIQQQKKGKQHNYGAGQGEAQEVLSSEAGATDAQNNRPSGPPVRSPIREDFSDDEDACCSTLMTPRGASRLRGALRKLVSPPKPRDTLPLQAEGTKQDEDLLRIKIKVSSSDESG